MRVPTLFACILVAATASATATPRPEGYDERGPYGTRQPRHHPKGEHDWVMLASPTPTRFGTEYFVVAQESAWVRTLRIDALSGSVVVRQIEVVSHDRSSKTYLVNRRLDQFHPTAYVDLGVPRRIDQLIVTTNRWPKGMYAIYGSPAPLPVVREVAER